MQKQSPRGILSPDRLVLSPRQRQEYLRLKASGIPDVVARQMAFAFDKSATEADVWADAMVEMASERVVHKRAAGLWEDAALTAALGLQKASSTYHSRFVANARESLPDEAFNDLHARARGHAGGRAAANARADKADPKAALEKLWAARNDLTAKLHELDQQIAAVPVAKDAVIGDTHVDIPLPAPAKRRKKKKVAKQEGVSAMTADRNNQYVPLVEADDRPIDQRMVGAARLVSGMDYEMRLGANGPDDARARASRNLTQNVSQYDRAFQADADLRAVAGIDIDLGSGQARAPGALGLDLYPYDYGTALHDVSLGLPFKDSSVRSVRLVNALEFMQDFNEDATPLLTDIQRVLNYGGKLFYEGLGDLEDQADFGQLPGLVLVEHEDTTPALPSQDASQTQLHRQVFERVRVRVPRFYGADPEWAGSDEETPLDVAIALDAMGASADSDYLMADLFGKAEGTTPPKGVQAACKRGLELAPEYGGKGLTEGAKARARNMADGKAVSDANLRKMHGWFARHSTYGKTSSPPSPGYVAWLLWGGDAGKKWADSQAGRMEKKTARPPLGAAFAHARASGKKKDKKSVRRRASDYLRSKGHEGVSEKSDQMAMRVDGGSLVAKAAAGNKQWEHLATSVIYSPDELDTDGEYIEADCLKALAHQAMLDRVPIKLEHSGDPVDADLVESYIAPVSFTMDGPSGPQSIRKGAWVGTFKIRDPQLWQAIVDGELRGVSVGGTAAGEYR